jgi:hypothetical protein
LVPAASYPGGNAGWEGDEGIYQEHLVRERETRAWWPGAASVPAAWNPGNDARWEDDEVINQEHLV